MFRGLAAAIQAGTNKPDIQALFLWCALNLFNYQGSIPLSAFAGLASFTALRCTFLCLFLALFDYDYKHLVN